MNALRFLLVGALAVGSAAPALAQRIQIEVQPEQVRPKIVLGAQAETPLLTPEAVEKLKFTDKQKESYTKIETDYKDKSKTAQEKFRTDIQGVRDREKYKEALDKMQADTKKAREDSLAKIEPLLTADQKTVFAEVKNQQPQPGRIVRPLPIGGVGGGIGQVLPPAVQQRLQLTDEQKKQIEAIQKETEAKILKVLTDEQKKQLDTIKKGPNVRPVQPIQRQPIRIQPAVPNAIPAAPAPKKEN
jgi:hypothetical protein